MTGPIEVWLRKKNLAVKCMVVHEDESTSEMPVRSLSMRGAQREITTRLKAQNYQPAGRWEATLLVCGHPGGDESVRLFWSEDLAG